MRQMHQASTVSLAETRKAAESIDPLLVEIRKIVLAHEFSPHDTRAMLASLVSDGVGGNFNDYGAAEQAAMAIGSLVESLRHEDGLNVSQAEQFNSALKEIDSVLKNENAFEADRLIMPLKTIAATLNQSPGKKR
jgi:hypothetical protein